MQQKIKLAKYFDHTVLKPEITSADIEKLCSEAAEYGFFSVCVNPVWVKLSKKLLKGSKVDICTVVGFPLGANTTKIKIAETELALEEGAKEIDMVINIGKLKEGDTDFVRKEISKLKKITGKRILKVIIETALLTEDEKRTAIKLVKDAGADFVKTSTGFAKSGATIDDISLMRKIGGKSLKVKASGGVKTLDFALALIEAGANRIGASSSVDIMEDWLKKNPV
jgi:deoxyribose-phosphate aldolase